MVNRFFFIRKAVHHQRRDLLAEPLGGERISGSVRMPFRNEDPSWRAVVLLTATACTLTAASVFLYVANSVLHAPSRRQRPRHPESEAVNSKTMANAQGMGSRTDPSLAILRLTRDVCGCSGVPEQRGCVLRLCRGQERLG